MSESSGQPAPAWLLAVLDDLDDGGRVWQALRRSGKAGPVVATKTDQPSPSEVCDEITVTATARRLKVSDRHVRRMLDSRRLEARRVSAGKRLVQVASIEAFEATRRTRGE
jgi:excisionase family DNA binding protein